MPEHRTPHSWYQAILGYVSEAVDAGRTKGAMLAANLCVTCSSPKGKGWEETPALYTLTGIVYNMCFLDCLSNVLESTCVIGESQKKRKEILHITISLDYTDFMSQNKVAYGAVTMFESY